MTTRAGDPDDVRPLLDVRTQLGEGLHWDAAKGCLWLVDIVGRRLLRWRPGETAWREWATPQPVGWVLPRGGDLVLGLAEGMARATLADGELTLDWICRPHAGQPWMRLNDAKLDATGAIWAGSLNQHDETRPDGRLYRLGPDDTLSEADGGYSVANGPAIHPDGRLLLHTDSVRRVIYAFDLDAAAGRLGGKRVWRQFEAADGHPDGMSFDRDGCVWVAHWGASCVCRYDAEARLLQRIALPASQVTNVCFFGPALDRMAVTTARVGLDAATLAAQPLAGMLFEVVQPQTRGFDAAVRGPR